MLELSYKGTTKKIFKDYPHNGTNILGSQKRDLRYSTIEEQLRWKKANKTPTKEKHLCCFCCEVSHHSYCCGKKTTPLGCDSEGGKRLKVLEENKK